MYCKLRDINYYFWNDRRNWFKVYSYCCKSYIIKVMWLYSSLVKNKLFDVRVNG